MTDIICSIPRYPAWRGPALLGAGFRSFFGMDGLWATLARVAAGYTAVGYMALLAVAGAAWAAVLLMFLAVSGPMLLAPRVGR